MYPRTSVQMKTMQYLGHYGFLTMTQMVDYLKIAGKRNNLGTYLKPLRQDPKPMIKVLKQGIREDGEHASFTKPLEDIYILTKEGQEFVSNLGDRLFDDEPKAPKLSHFKQYSYHHRTDLITLQILLEKEQKDYGYKVGFFHRSLEWQNGKEQASFIIPSMQKEVKPDAVFSLEGKDEFPRIYCLEYERGVNVKKLTNKIELYARAMFEQVVTKKYGLEKSGLNFRLLIVCENESLLKGCIKALPNLLSFRQLIEPITDNLLLFTTKAEYERDHFHHWTDMQGRQRDLW